LLVGTTVAEQSVKHPTDISLLNKSREISEKLIDEFGTKISVGMTDGLAFCGLYR